MPASKIHENARIIHGMRHRTSTNFKHRAQCLHSPFRKPTFPFRVPCSYCRGSSTEQSQHHDQEDVSKDPVEHTADGGFREAYGIMTGLKSAGSFRINLDFSLFGRCRCGRRRGKKRNDRFLHDQAAVRHRKRGSREGLHGQTWCTLGQGHTTGW